MSKVSIEPAKAKPAVRWERKASQSISDDAEHCTDTAEAFACFGIGRRDEARQSHMDRAEGEKSDEKNH